MSIPQAGFNIQFRADQTGRAGNAHPPLGLPPAAPPAGEALPGLWIPGGDGLSYAVPFWTSASAVRVGGLWLYQETVLTLNTISGSRSPLEIARDAVARGLNRITELSQGVLTQHALMVAWGEFAQEIGLIQKLRQVPMPQKGVVHAPQAKVLTFLMGILTGITHLKDLNEGPHPLAHDWAVMRAWGLAALPHYTGVSRTLAGCDEETVAAIVQALQAVSQPFIDQEVQQLRTRKEPLLLDLDLAPRRVSNTSTTYPEAEFGWQGDGVGLGYEAALVSFASPTYGRLFLTGFHHPRNPIALPRLQKMIREAEARLRVRPRRRTELVARRLRRLEQRIAQRQGWLETQRAKQEKATTRLATLPAEIAHLEAEVAALEAAYQAQGRVEKPHSRLAKARRRLARAQQQLAQAPQALERAQQAAVTHQRRLEALQAEHAALSAYLAQLQADNESNPDPVTIIVRMDAGFGTGANLAWLIEMGYIVYTKAHNAQVAARLKGLVAADAPWTRVGKNAEMMAWEEQYIRHCPYPLTVALERFHTPAGWKHSTLLLYRDDGRMPTLPAWFAFYNGRQTIEAGIKEGNVVFKMHPLKMRSRAGITLQEHFVLFAANFVRWAMVWLRDRVSRSRRRFDEALRRVKAMVRVAANTSAWMVADAEGLLVRFDETGAYPGVELRLTGIWRARPPLLPRKQVQDLDFTHEPVPGCT